MTAPLLVTSARLVASPLAVAVSRLVVRHTLKVWDLDDHTDTAGLAMSELVTNAVKATNDPHGVIGVQLCAVASSLYVEVWDDRADALPVRKRPESDAEGGRGLLLVDAVAETWGVERPPAGGKVVWAELALGWPLTPPPPGTLHPPLQLPPGSRALRSRTEERAKRALYERVLTTVGNAVSP
ncbi:ATP-binding protein [Streptomyces niveiscabiei]|uniref:ATP-binding protein n=1 Tax=Streptomyces niveiscabiei TaxID=164115 RepID=UPI0029AB75B4|nr:ATP-binding protein [Streptomyces niveiscabiei]MDX3386801.1 ATP-binding protein [Streptomyces niveiscabiei]